MDSWGITDSGKVRSINQDVCKIVIDDKRGFAILVVCDGMGGANAGNIASELAADVFSDYMSDNTAMLGIDATLDDIADVVADAAVAANTAVFNKGMSDIQYSGMGTTLVSLISSNNGEIVVNIGDSRAYHITPAGISQITKDHSVVEDMVDSGELSRTEALNHPRKNLITRAVGAERFVESDIYMQTIDSGDIILLCSDGLSNIVKDDEILDVMQNSTALSSSCQALMDIALTRGAPDNVTIAVFKKS